MAEAGPSRGFDAGASTPPEDRVVVGKITTVHGVRGWVKIHSFTEPEGNIFDYRPWWMKLPTGWTKLEVDDFKPLNKGFIAHIRGLDDRDEARGYCQREILVAAAAMPEPGEGEFYWHQLLGLRVESRHGGCPVDLGVLSGFLETGANDVMVVKDGNRERLIPWIDDVVLEVDQASGAILVDWDPDFEASGD